MSGDDHPGARRQPTLDTVAAAAGVSRATVSRVVTNSATVSPDVRALVEATIRRLGYVPNRTARSLAKRRTDSVALVLREADATVLADPYLASMIIATSRSLVGTGVQLVLVNSRDDVGNRTLADYVRGGHVDGVLLASMHADDPLPQILVDARVPTVVGGRPERPVPGLVYVDCDNLGGGRLAADHLIGTGRRRITSIAGPPDMTAAADRLTGYHRALAHAGLPSGQIAFGDFSRASGERAMTELLDRDPELDAVFAANDLMAVGAIRVLRAAGRRVPEQVAVVGYDDVELASLTEPALTTVRQPVMEQASTMTALLLRRIGGAPPGDPVLLPVELVRRESS